MKLQVMQYFGMAAANFPSVVVAKAGSGELDKGEMCVSSSSLLLSSLELSDTKVYWPQTLALLGTSSHFCEVVILKLRTVPIGTALNLRTLPVKAGSGELDKGEMCVPPSHRVLLVCQLFSPTTQRCLASPPIQLPLVASPQILSRSG